jgi:cytochrome b involved in lipid metabolism
VVANDSLRVYTRGQVAQHNNDEDLWVIVDQRVYDLTEWANFHPGSREVLVRHAGCDATEYFTEVGHSDFARSKMNQFLVGRVDTPPRYNASEYRERPGET